MKDITSLPLLCPCLHHRSSYCLENRTKQKTKVTYIQKSLHGQQNMSEKKALFFNKLLSGDCWYNIKSQIVGGFERHQYNFPFLEDVSFENNITGIFYLLVAILNRMVWIYKLLRECSCAHCFSRFNPLNMHTFYGPLSLFLMRMSWDPLDTPTFRNHSFFIPPMYRNPRSVAVSTVKLNTS